ncbi:MAG: hypothetical protein ACF8MJ_03050 [Phycisphaerales bacterium JB050]
MARFTPLFISSVLVFIAGSALAGPDDSPWYQTGRPAAQPTPAEPATPTTPSATTPKSGSSVSVRVGASRYSYGGDYYYPSGTGYPNVHPYYYGYGRGFYYGRYYYPTNWRYIRTYDTPDTSTLIELARRYDPQLIGADPNAEPPTSLELGEIAMKRAEYAEAITKFAEAHDEQKRAEAGSDQPNRQAQRLLGIAYAADRQFEFAGKQLAEAFETDASLRNLPIRGEDLFKDGLELTSIVSRAVGYAHRKPSYESWFTVAVLMQAQGKNDLANDMIKRAEAARSAASGQNTAEPTEPAQQTPQAAPKPAKRPSETEADRLRRELRESTERLEETKHRLEEIKRKQREAAKESGTEG